MRMPKKKSAIVPKALWGIKLAAVVPACALACSGPDPLLNFGYEFTVAQCCFGVADATFGVAADAFRPPPKDAAQEASPDDAPADAPEDVVDE